MASGPLLNCVFGSGQTPRTALLGGRSPRIDATMSAGAPGGLDVVGADDGGAQPDRHRHGRQGALEPLIDRKVEGLPDEVLAGGGHQHREPERYETVGGPHACQRIGRRLAEIESGIDDDPLRRNADRQVAGGAAGQLRADVGHHPVLVVDVTRIGARGQPAGMGDDVAGLLLGGHRGQVRIRPGPGVVDDVDQPGAGACHLGAPGIQAEQDLRVLGAGPLQEGANPLGLLGRRHLRTLLTRAHTADVDDVGALLRHLIETAQGVVEGVPGR
jgi:hypothetical protein